MADTLESSIHSALVTEARTLGIDVERELALALRDRIAQRKRQIAWQNENRAAIQLWNEEVEKNGLWYEHLKRP